MRFPAPSTLALAAALALGARAQQQDCAQTIALPASSSSAPCTQTIALSSSSSAAVAPVASSSVAVAPAASSSAPAARASLDGANLVLMPLGDSITYGFGSSDGNGYRAALYDELVAAGATVDMVGSLRSGSMADGDNEGHSGWTIDQIEGAAAGVAGLNPNLVLVHVGTNDANGYPNPEQMPDRLMSLLDLIVGQWPDAGFLVAQIIPSTSAGTQANIDAYNAQIPDIVSSYASAGTKMAVVDMDTSEIALGDYLHPNDQGYVTMGGLWFDAIENAAAEGWF